jgi:hypothetical protein
MRAGWVEEAPVGLWVRNPQLMTGESIAWSKLANREQSDLRQVGGRLFVTTRRVVFEPNIVDRVTRGERWEASTAAVLTVETLPAAPAMPVLGRAARLRTRLLLRLSDGQEEVFVINGVRAAVDELSAALGTR